jgi:threonine synthase
MLKFRDEGHLEVDDDIYKRIIGTFKSASSTDDEIRTEIKRIYDKYEYIVCPHTATGTMAAEKFRTKGKKMVVLATAHPAKFPDVVTESIGIHPDLPEHLSDLLSKPEKFLKIPNDIDLIKNYIYQNSL